MAVENITLNLIPTGDTPSIHVAQFDVDRPFTVTLKEGEDDFTPTGYTIELQIRKVDNNIVTAATTSVSGNIVTFNTTEQMTACSGTNLAELQLTKDSQTFATLHFYLVVQRDVLAGGVTSESDIYNLTEQIAEIVPEVIGDDYYTKEEVDEIIEDIPTFDPTNYYDKSETDALLDDKANTSSLSAVAFSGDYNDLENKPDIPDVSNYYTKSEVDTKITDLYQIKTASGSIVHITDGGNNIPVKVLKSDILTVQSGSGTPSPINPRSISSFNSGDITVTDNDQISDIYTVNFGQTVYGGSWNVTTGKLIINGNGFKLVDNNRIALQGFSDNNNVWRILGATINALNNNKQLCNIATYNVNAWSPADSRVNTFVIGDEGNLYIQLSKSVANTLEDFITYITNNDVYFYHEMSTPTDVQLTPTKVKTLSGENNISSNTGDIEVEYFTEKSDGIAELIRAFL